MNETNKYIHTHVRAYTYTCIYIRMYILEKLLKYLNWFSSNRNPLFWQILKWQQIIKYNDKQSWIGSCGL